MQGEVMKTQLAARLRSYSEKVKRSAEGAPMPYFKLTDKEDKEIILTISGKISAFVVYLHSGN